MTEIKFGKASYAAGEMVKIRIGKRHNPSILNSHPYTLNPKPQTLNPKIPKPKPETLNLKP